VFTATCNDEKQAKGPAGGKHFRSKGTKTKATKVGAKKKELKK